MEYTINPQAIINGFWMGFLVCMTAGGAAWMLRMMFKAIFSITGR